VTLTLTRPWSNVSIAHRLIILDICAKLFENPTRGSKDIERTVTSVTDGQTDGRPGRTDRQTTDLKQNLKMGRHNNNKINSNNKYTDVDLLVIRLKCSKCAEEKLYFSAIKDMNINEKFNDHDGLTSFCCRIRHACQHTSKKQIFSF